jgi:hypothetical protein
VDVGAELAGATQQRPHPARRVVAAQLGGIGMQQRRQGGDLDREVDARNRSQRIRFEPGIARPAAGLVYEGLERLGAAPRVAVGLRLGHGRLTEQVERGSNPRLPELPQRRQRVAGRLADDEAMGHVLDPHRGGRAECSPARLGVGGAHRRRDRWGSLAHLLQVLAQVTGELVERAAGGGDVDEPEKRRAQLAVLARELHRPLVEGTNGVAGRGGQRGVKLATDPLELALQGIGRWRRRWLGHDDKGTPRRDTPTAAAP